MPCGGQGQPSCTVGCFFVMIDNIFRFVLFSIATPLAATAFMAAGILLVLGGSESAITRGKSIFTYTFIGIVLVFGAWLIIDLILGNLLSPGYLPWNEFPSSECQGAVVPSSSAPSLGSPSQPLSVVQPSSPSSYSFDTGAYLDGVYANTSGFESLKNEPPEGTGLSPSTNPSSNCNPAIASYLQGANLNGVEEKRVAAIIQSESSGRASISSLDNDGKRSYGLMQVRTDTARLYDSSLANLSDSQVGDKLVNDPSYNINIGTKYYADLSRKYGDPTLAHTAYNGGPLANRASVNCPGVRRWQCEWDNNEHTLPNERPGHPGYGPTRKYVQNIDKYYSQDCSR